MTKEKRKELKKKVEKDYSRIERIITDMENDLRNFCQSEKSFIDKLIDALKRQAFLFVSISDEYDEEIDQKIQKQKEYLNRIKTKLNEIIDLIERR